MATLFGLALPQSQVALVSTSQNHGMPRTIYRNVCLLHQPSTLVNLPKSIILADTPPGHDSRVTTALKKHYIKQVSDPRQLPAWLFSDIERQVGRASSRRTETTQAAIEQDPSRSYPSSPVPAPVRARARHEDAYAQPQTRERSRTATYDGEHTGPTRAATRLRALRDARRGPTEREREVYAPQVEPEPIRELERVQLASVSAPVPARPRVGLPPRPGRIRRE